MSVFEGIAQTVPEGKYATSANEMPKFMQDAIYNQIQLAQNIAATPYQEYNLPTVAELTPDQQRAFAQVRASQGQWSPAMELAQRGTAALAGAPGQAAAAEPYFQQVAGMSGLGTAQPALQAQANLLGGLNYNAPVSNLYAAQGQYLNPQLAGSALQAGQQAYGAAGGIDIGAAASPYLQQAAQTSAAGVQQYMNPYQEGVMNAIAQQGARNLSENLLPAVSDAFIRAGQFGGTRMGEFGERAVRDTQEAILAQQAQALQQGYGQALSASQADLARQAQLAGTAGQLTGQQQAALVNLGQAQTAAGQAQQQAGLGAAQNVAGAQQQAINQALQSAGQYGQLGGALGALTADQQRILAGLGTSAAGFAGGDINTRMAALSNLASLAQAQQGMSAKDAAALEAIGQTQQANMQQQLSAAYQQQQQQQLYQQQMADWLSTQIRGMAPITPQQTTTNQAGTTVQYGASPLSQLAGAYGLYKGLTSTS